jgi:hypothetical protein
MSVNYHITLIMDNKEPSSLTLHEGLRQDINLILLYFVLKEYACSILAVLSQHLVPEKSDRES